MSAEHRVQLGPPEPAVLAALDEGWNTDETCNRMQGYGKGASGQWGATHDLGECLGSDDPNLKMVGIYRDDKPVGLFWVVYEGDKKRTVQLHINISPKARGQWVFEHAGRELMAKLFDNGVYRVEVEPLRINKRMVKLLRHYGFKQEGIKRSAFWMDNNDYDTVLLRMLRREWKRKEN